MKNCYINVIMSVSVLRAPGMAASVKPDGLP
jgi:hypothetical protein